MNLVRISKWTWVNPEHVSRVEAYTTCVRIYTLAGEHRDFKDADPEEVVKQLLQASMEKTTAELLARQTKEISDLSNLLVSERKLAEVVQKQTVENIRALEDQLALAKAELNCLKPQSGV